MLDLLEIKDEGTDDADSIPLSSSVRAVFASCEFSWLAVVFSTKVKELEVPKLKTAAMLVRAFPQGISKCWDRMGYWDIPGTLDQWKARSQAFARILISREILLFALLPFCIRNVVVDAVVALLFLQQKHKSIN